MKKSTKKKASKKKASKKKLVARETMRDEIKSFLNEFENFIESSAKKYGQNEDIILYTVNVFINGDEIKNEGDEITKVRFIVFKGEILALFPEIPENNDCILSYQTIGQHGAASKSLLKCKKATPEQYEKLRNELTGIGYNLEVL